MADEITATGSSVKFTPHPEGQFAARCVDTIALGEKVEQWGDFPEKLVTKVALVFRTGEKNADDHYIDLSAEFTLSMGDKANLRKFLEQWRGKPYTEEQVEAGVPLHKLLNQNALVSVAHKRSRRERTYAVINAIMPLPKAMPPVAESLYDRADYWEERKKEYAKGVQDYKRSVTPVSDDFSDFPEGQDDDSDMPF